MKVNGHQETPDTKVIMEDVAGKFGFRCRYEFTDVGVAFVIWQIVARQPDGLKLALFPKASAKESIDLTPDVIAADPYLSGCLRADGRIMLNSSAVFMGAKMMKRHLALEKHVWHRCKELLGIPSVTAAKEWETA